MTFPVMLTLSFQSTPSVGRTTKVFKKIGKFTTISIHALRGEDDWVKDVNGEYTKISIHALRGEDDCDTKSIPLAAHISIHALRGEDDV